jgi:hypothetical protein
MDIDFNQDIAPLRQQYFPMLAGERGFDQAMKYRQEVLMPMREQTLNLYRTQQQIRSQDLAFEQQQFAFQQAREKAKRENEAFAMKPVIDEKINSLLDDEVMSTDDKMAELGKLSLSVAPYLTRDSPLTQMFSVTSGIFQSQAASEQKKKAEALRKEKETLGLVDLASKIGKFDLAEELASADGISTAESLMMAAGKQSHEQGQQEKERLTKLAEAKAYGEATSNYVDLLKNFKSSLAGLKFKSGGFVTDEDGEIARDPEGNPILASEQDELGNSSKQQLLGALKFLYPSMSDDEFDDRFGKSSDVNLLRLANETVSNEMAKYTPKPDRGIGIPAAFD